MPGKNSGVLDTIGSWKKATYMSCAKLKLHHNSNYEIKKNVSLIHSEETSSSPNKPSE